MASRVNHPRILVVDDEPTLRLLVRRVLEQKGYTVDVAENGRDGLDKIASFHPDLVVLDLMMPVMDGWEVLERLRQTEAPPPVIILSAFADPARAERAGARACLNKPFRLAEFREACERVLGA